ncbi:MAG: glycine--tRNA ligase subunit beta [Fusobacteriaceae bacterium]|nr:glycine--tRNA ligase subunit beta [Fusobacteriaceae bacterium]MBP9509632.1 glycine--tRNA ligase subunit beta [Fusobacteriaceae bacterium]
MKLLFEIGMEEIPARFLDNSLEELKANMEKKLSENRVKFESIKTFGTPRRLVLYVEGVAEKQEDLDVVNMGPAKSVAFSDSGEVSRAGLGFLKSQGVDVDGMTIVSTPKGEYIAVKKFMKGGDTESLLPEMLKSLVLELSFPKSMKWADKNTRFARPLKWFLAFLDNKVLNFDIEGLKSGNISRGHRFFGEEFTINSVDEYFGKVRENNVIIDIQERKDLIKKLIEENCVEKGERAVIEEELLNEVANLVEYPFPLVGTFNSDFLEVPQEVLIISMQVHQRYFPILNNEGKLQPKFIVVRNGVEGSEYVRKGNEKVISARLSDARFFYNEDLKEPLYKNVEKLKSVVYQKDLGTIYNKIERMQEIAEVIIKQCGLEDRKENIERTIHLCKADLVSNMIGEKEFTKLQGFMGAEYAIKSGESSKVALGIKEHYYPRFQGDMLPTELEGAITGICDKLDTLVGCFAVGLIPTGSKDPFALRRAALGIVNVILNSKLEISLQEIIKFTLDILEKKSLLKREKSLILSDLEEFMLNRILNVFADLGYSRDVVSAVLNAKHLTLLEMRDMVEALETLKKEPVEYNKLVNVVKRIANISKDCKEVRFVEDLLKEQVEKDLFFFMGEFEDKLVALNNEKKYVEYMKEMIAATPIIEKYFEGVLIMDKDEVIKNNRLSQMKILDEMFNKVLNLRVLENVL